MESLSSFMDIIYGVSLRGWGKTRCVGCQLGRRGFEVSSYYRVLACGSDFSFPCSSIWKPKVPCKVVFFVWTVALGNILTIDNLQGEKFLYWIGFV